jgi:hypothetical protein
MKLCKKCKNFHHAEDSQDDDGCKLVYPLKDCPYIIKVLEKPIDWRMSEWHNGANGGKRCAGELEDIFRVK